MRGGTYAQSRTRHTHSARLAGVTAVSEPPGISSTLAISPNPTAISTFQRKGRGSREGGGGEGKRGLCRHGVRIILISHPPPPPRPPSPPYLEGEGQGRHCVRIIRHHLGQAGHHFGMQLCQVRQAGGVPHQPLVQHLWKGGSISIQQIETESHTPHTHKGRTSTRTWGN